MSKLDTIIFNGFSKAEQNAITSFLVQIGKASIDAQRRVAVQLRSTQLAGKGMTVSGVALSNAAISYVADAIDRTAGKDR